MIVEVGDLAVNTEQVHWDRPEYRNRWSLLITRKEAAALLGVKSDGLSAMRARYADSFPPYVGKFGHHALLVRSEVEDFAKELQELRAQSPGRNHNRRSQRNPLEQARSELVHVRRKKSTLEARIAKVAGLLQQLEADLAVERGREKIIQERITVLST